MIPFQWVFFVAGIFELAVAIICFSRERQLAIILIAWLATIFLVYRIGLICIGYRKLCGCPGNLTDALHTSPQAADNVMKAVLAYLLVGSYGILIWEWTRRRQMRKSENRESGNVEGGARANNSLSADLPIADSQ